jgi:glucokinase
MADPLLLGIEIGGTKLQLGLGRGDGRLLALSRRAIQPEQGAEGILAQVAAEFGPLAAQLGADPEPVGAVGIGFGGPVDADRGVVTRSHQVAGWDSFPLADWVRRRLGVVRVAIHNDADTAGLAEARFGAGAGLSPILYLTIGSGIGGGLIIDGQIYRGAGAGAVEIGHLWIHPEPGDPDPGPPRRLEDVASGWAIARAARAAELDAAVVAHAAARGDPAASRVVRRAVHALAQALAHAVTLLAPRRIILGGGVSLMDRALWLDPLRDQLLERVFPPFRTSFDMAAAALGEEVVVHGALALAHDAWANTRSSDTLVGSRSPVEGWNA